MWTSPGGEGQNGQQDVRKMGGLQGEGDAAADAAADPPSGGGRGHAAAWQPQRGQQESYTKEVEHGDCPH